MYNDTLFYLESLSSRFSRNLPLKNGIEIELFIDMEGPFSLRYNKKQFSVVPVKPRNPDFTFYIPRKAIMKLYNFSGNDMSEIGLLIIELLTHKSPQLQIHFISHISSIKILKHGYFKLIPIGGKKVVDYLAKLGIKSIFEILQMGRKNGHTSISRFN